MTLSFKDNLNRSYSSFSLKDFLPYDRFDPPSSLFISQSSIGLIMETVPLVGCTEDMQREISMLFRDLLPEGFMAQFLFLADSHTEKRIQKWVEHREKLSPMLSRLAHQREDYLKKITQNPYSSTHPRHFRLILSVSVSTEDKKENHEKQDIQTLLLLKDQIVRMLETLGLPLWMWHAQDLLQFLTEFFHNPYQIPSVKKWSVLDSLRDQVQSNESIEIKEDGVYTQETALRSYRVAHSPAFWSLYAMHELIGDVFRNPMNIPVPFAFHYGVYVPKQDSIQNAFHVKAAWVERQVRAPNMRKMLPHLAEEAEETQFVREQLSKGERLVHTSFQVILFSKETVLAKAEQSLLGLFKSKQWELIPNRFLHWPCLLSCLPLVWGEGINQDLSVLDMTKTTLTSESANVVPFQGEWQGNSLFEGRGMMLVGRRGQLMGWDPFSNNAGNYNVSVVGRSGSGKSVLMQELMTSILGSNGRVFVIDVGRSFEKICHLLEGQFIEFTPTFNLSLNPFQVLSTLKLEEQEDTIAVLKPILGLMVAPTQGITDEENALLEKAIRALLNQDNPSITAFANYLLDQDDATAKKLGRMLYPYTEEGAYGRFFDGETHISFNNPLVVIEMEELKERKDLQAVIVQMVILYITQTMFGGDRQTPFMIVFDEAWDLLRGSQAGSFIETLARRVRKYRGSLVVGTQSIQDFFQSPAAQAAFENSDWTLLLSQRRESVALLKDTKKIVMDPHMESLLQSVKTKQGEYSEAMIYGPHGYAIGRLMLDPFSRILYSTKAQEYGAVRSIQATGIPLEEAIHQVACQIFPDEMSNHV